MYEGSNGGMNPGGNPGQGPGFNPAPAPNPIPPPPPNLNPAPTPPPVPEFIPAPNPGPGPGAGKAMLFNYWVKQHWKLLLLIFVAVFILGETIFQIVYPSSRLIPGTQVDGVDLGGMRKQEAADKLDGLYGGIKLGIYFGKNQATFQSPKMSEVGIGVDNEARLEAIDYPFYLRFIPGSIWWAPALQHTGEIVYTYDKNKIASYTTSQVGDDCSIPPQNATLKLVDSQLQLVPSVTGGTCDITEFQQALAQVKPNSDQNSEDNTVRIAIDETPAPVTDDMARALAAKLNGRLASPMPIQVDKSTDTIPGRVVLSWLDFKAVVPEKSIDNSANQQASLQFSVNQKRMEAYLNEHIASKLVIQPGVSQVSTLDFKETSRVNGKNGRAIDMPRASQSVVDYINNKIQKAIGATVVVGPTTVYKRSYTPTSTGFAALISQYAQDNGGKWSIAFQELNGVRFPRSASYNGNARMKAAGVHSLYLAYTDVMEQFKGNSRPVDKISGDTNATDCFKYMLQRFDRGCRTGFYDHYGFATLTAHGKEIGLKNTVFAGEDTLTSANDLKDLMVGLFKNKIARVEGGQKILSTARTNRYNEGIPDGAGTGQISHYIGENDSGTVHNDAAIVYSTNYGAYVLVALTEDSSWEKISGLADKIRELKTVKIPTTN